MVGSGDPEMVVLRVRSPLALSWVGSEGEPGASESYPVEKFIILLRKRLIFVTNRQHGNQ